jgi:hypothetical protein
LIIKLKTRRKAGRKKDVDNEYGLDLANYLNDSILSEEVPIEAN